MVTRSVGICVNGFVVGGGYEGKTKELDNLIIEASKYMQETFKRDITIRYNSDGESGGAWIKDNEWSCKIGLTARLAKSKLLAMTSEEKINTPIEIILNFPNDVIVIETLVDESLLQDKSLVGYHSNTKRHNTLQEGIDWIISIVDPDALKEYLIR